MDMNNMKTTYKKSLQLLFHLTGIACLLLALVSCEKDSSAPASDTIDYSDNRCWFENKQDATGKDVDLFYARWGKPGTTWTSSIRNNVP